MPLHVPAPAVALEGDYSDYTIYDSFDETEGYVGTWENAALLNREETVAILIDPNICKLYTIATKSLGSSLFDPSILSGGVLEMGLAIRSVLGTYVVSIDDGYDNLYIMKNGVVIKTMGYADLGLKLHNVDSVSISPSGKYIAVKGKRTATDNYGWVVLEGS